MSTEERLITVCGDCLRAQCWHADLMDNMCEASRSAGTVELLASKLDEMNLEHPDNYSVEKIHRITGL